MKEDYDENDIYNSHNVIQLFNHSTCLINHSVPLTSMGMNWEILMKKI